MKKILKQVVPHAVLKKTRAARARKNRMKILSACNSRTKVFVQPENRVEHYFHFIFDLCLPLWLAIDSAPTNATFQIREFGIFSERVPALFGGRVEIIDRSVDPIENGAIPLVGMNPQFVAIDHADACSFRARACQFAGADPERVPDKVLLIERMPPNSYFQNEAVKKGAGASRRSIPNHDELRDMLAELVPTPLELVNVQLENLDFPQQIRLFDEAVAVVGQHGAGLANCLWMRPRSNVAELSHRTDLRHFLEISAAMRHEYAVMQTSGPHDPIDVEEVKQFLIGCKRFSTTFGR